jgi:hypothetical protein
MSHRWKTRVAAAVLGLAVLGSSCYGPFNLTRRVHHWNGTVTENNWGQEGVFLLLVIVPVYELAMIGDWLIFNSIEFWGGENPISPPATAQVLDDGRTLTLEKFASADGPALRLAISQDATLVQDLRLTALPGQTVLRDASGALLATAVTLPDGQVLVRDARGVELARGHAPRD